MKNPELQLANDFVQYTSHNIFLTGKAGTGKTTFLHKLKESTPKRMIVTAPTGVAAINAGGVTLHSFFQMPFGPYVPGSDVQRQAEQRRFSKEKINIIRSLDLLVIDEISMVRADLLDGVDAVLRRYKHHHLPFGGVQLLMIGDLHQLSPVVKNDEWNLLKNYYDTWYFFSSNALKQTNMISIELKHIYRQSDAFFIQLLNRVRDNQLDSDTIQALNTRYIPAFHADNKKNYITLTTHNRSADNINDKQLAALNSKSFTFQAMIEDDYPVYNYPTAEKLTLKKGAQVMFVRNDSSTDKLYFNGKIGKIIQLDQHCITVKCPNDGGTILVEPVTWENIKYTVDAKTKEITEEVIGTFTQHPLRLAWAITIHKSQGLTFERAIIDANAAFSHGQVYVALSRCKTFEGIVLSTPISQRAVKTDTKVAQFVEHASRNPPTQQQLNSAKILYQQKILLDSFDYQSLATNLTYFTKQLRNNHSNLQFSGSETIEEIKQQVIEEIITVADKFKRQLQSLFKHDKAPEDDSNIQDRVRKASCYFTDKFQLRLIEWLSCFNFDTDNKELRKQINKALELLQHNLAIKIACLHSCRTGFSTSACLNAVSHAEIDFKSYAPAKQQSVDADVADLQHPELFKALKTWRAKQAKKEEVEHYRILHQRVLIQIAGVLPDTLDALLHIKGIGKHTAEKYGNQLTAIVSEYCREHNIQPQQTPPEPTIKKETKKDSKQISYELYLQGKDINEIADHRGMVASTIEGHLAYYVRLNQLDITELVTEEKIAVIKQAFDEKGHESLKIIKEYLDDKFSYSEIRLVRESLR
ncbi:MAG: AAA family ATPase [Gammaproteobacteria bacterium]|nr:AAA family ATPase [Gammaproteobacteria bacterium]